MKRRTTFAAMLLASISMPAIALAQDAEVTVDLNMRVGPSTRYPVINTIPAGGDVEIFGCVSSFDWCDVGWRGWRGWVFADYLEYFYNGRWVPVVEYRTRIDIPVVTYVFSEYVPRYYSDYPFYSDLLVRFEFEFDRDRDRDDDDDDGDGRRGDQDRPGDGDGDDDGDRRRGDQDRPGDGDQDALRDADGDRPRDADRVRDADRDRPRDAGRVRDGDQDRRGGDRLRRGGRDIACDPNRDPNCPGGRDQRPRGDRGRGAGPDANAEGGRAEQDY